MKQRDFLEGGIMSAILGACVSGISFVIELMMNVSGHPVILGITAFFVFFLLFISIVYAWRKKHPGENLWDNQKTSLHSWSEP